MRIVKIGAIWCGACLIMNKVWNRLKEDYVFDAIELEYDMDEEEVEKYAPGKVLPVFILFDGDQEIERLCGEFSYEDMSQKIEENGGSKK